MNYQWKPLSKQGEFGIGIVDIFELIEHSQRALKIIHFMSQHSHKERRVMLTVVLEGSKNNWTKGSIYNIFQDAETYIKDEAILKFGDLHNLVLKYMETQTFTLRNIDDFQYVTHGDFSFEDK